MMNKLKNGVILMMNLLALILLATATPAEAADPFAELFTRTRICFSHIAIVDGWQTEIAVINPTGKAVTGQLYFYDIQGIQLGKPADLTLNPNGRREIQVGPVYGNRGTIEYIIFTAPVYGLKGYSKFYMGDIRASIMASAPQTSGIFTKIERQGWTGIAFVNTSAETAHVVLKAFSDNGGEPVALKVMDVVPGAKVVKQATEIFAPQSIAGASYVSFTSDQGVVGFFLNGSAGMLDGSKAL